MTTTCSAARTWPRSTGCPTANSGRALDKLGGFDGSGTGSSTAATLPGAGRGRRRCAPRAEALTALAPLHKPKSLAALDAVTGLAPGVPTVACFDTAFHATLPPAAATYAVPAEWRDGLPSAATASTGCHRMQPPGG